MNRRSLMLAGVPMLAAAVASAQGEPHAQGQFDGTWAIDVRTNTGPCGIGFGGEYRISGGRIGGRFRQGGRIEEVTGSVGPDGAFLMRIGKADAAMADAIVLEGRMRWRLGWGEWQGRGCTGSFMTNRR